MRRLFSHEGHATDHELTLREYLDVPRPRPADRPWVELCMVASLDGSTVVDHNSRALSNPTDQELLLTLRSLVDVVLVGASTVRKEGYGPPKTPNLRVAVVSRSADFDFSLPLWTCGRVLLVLPEDAPQVPVPSVRAGVSELDLPRAVGMIDANVIQAEGGATLNGALAEADLIDELNLTLSPQMTGGDGPRLTVGTPPVQHRMRLAHVLEDDGFLFTRYVRAR
jgi:riboflavin biosynthesis pyrimidine reductase